MKNQSLFLIFALLILCSITRAQVPETMHGLTVGGNTENNVYVAIGQLFSQHSAENGYEVTAGFAQAQLLRTEIFAERYLGEGYDENGFLYPTSIPVGNYSDSKYSFAGSYNYDSLTVLYLLIKPLDVVCEPTVTDIEGNVYPVLSLAGYCWTKTNMRTQHYSNDNAIIAKALVYRSGFHPDEDANLNIYGRLYTWYSAVRVPENSLTTPISDTDGFVQGVCPNGWHIPNNTEMTALHSFSAEDLRSTELWLHPNNNTNSTGFTALPAGKFNSATNRFENLLGETAFWHVGADPMPNTYLKLVYYCDDPLLGQSADAYSVRCVKNY